MTNVRTDENPFDGWRTEIREFCDEVRQQLASIGDNIEATQQSATQPTQATTDLPPAAEQNNGSQKHDEPLSPPTVCDAPRPVSQAAGSVKTGNGNPAPGDNAVSKDDRLQSVRRQLQAMLNSVEA